MKDITGKILIIILLILGIILSVIYNRECSPGSQIDTTTIIKYYYDTIPVYDTVFIEMQGANKFIIHERDTLIFDTLAVFTDLNRIRNYSRTYFTQDIKLNVEVSIHGRLLDMQLQAANLKPAIIKTKEIERTITIKQNQRGVFLGAAAGSDLYLRADYLTRSGLIINYAYSPLNNYHLVGLSKKIF